MGSVNTPANPKTRATSHWAWLHSHQPWPGYILTSHHTIISPLIRQDTPGHVWGLSTRRLIQKSVRPHWGPGYILTIPHTIISPLIRWDAPGHVWGLSTRRLIQRRVRPHWGPGYILTIPHTIISPLIRRDAPGHVWGLSTSEEEGRTIPKVSQSTQGQTTHRWSNEPQGPRPPISDLKVPIGSTSFRMHVLQVWSRSDGWIAHNRRIERLLKP
ncbi:unnamed protein product [Prunus armeniaca]